MSEQPEPTGDKEIRELECTLDDAEFRARASEFARLHERREAVEVKLAALKKRYRDHLGGISSRFGSLAKVIATSKETRDVRCTWHRDWASSSMLLRRDDTQEVVDQRTMTADEKQLAFKIHDKGKNKKAKRERSKGAPKRLPADAGPSSAATATSDATVEQLDS